MENYSIVIYNDQGYTLCNAKSKPNDIFESGNIIVVAEKGIMEIFQFSQNDGKNEIKKIKEINNNNNNDNTLLNNNNINNNDDEILCIINAQKFVVCGHSSGLMSIWEPQADEYLKRLQAQKLHNGPINKILYCQLSDNMNYLISCSSDKKMNVYCMERNMVVNTQTFDEEVMDVKKLKDFDKKCIFIVSLKNGTLNCFSETFAFLFDIPSRFNTKTTRYVISLSNLYQNGSQSNNNNNNMINNNNMNEGNLNAGNNNKGDLLLITEGRYIDIFTWIKEGSFKVNLPIHPNHPNHPNHPKTFPKRGGNPFPHFNYQQGQFYPHI